MDGVIGVGVTGGAEVTGVSGVNGGAVDIEGAFLFRFIFFCNAAARTALPFT